MLKKLRKAIIHRVATEVRFKHINRPLGVVSIGNRVRLRFCPPGSHLCCKGRSRIFGILSCTASLNNEDQPSDLSF